MANEKTPVVWDDDTKKHRPLGTGEKMGGLDASSILSSDSGNLIQTGSDGLAYLSGGSIADPRADNLLEESANGKLQVTADRIVEWLGLNPSDAEKIAEALAAEMAGELADGQTITASGGKLHSDPTNATAAQKKAINQALADSSSGLVVDNSTGRLKVDFSNMPTDKFEELLKSLNMLVPLTQNLQLYVASTSDGDSIVDGRGTQAKPFKHIQNCVNYATETYSIGRYSIYINVAAGVYNENVALPEFSHGTGRIIIRPTSGARDVEIAAVTNSYGTRGWCLSASGGSWELQNLILSRVENPTTAQNVTTGCLAAGSNAAVYVSGIAFRQSFPSSPSPLGGNSYQCRLVWVTGGANVTLDHGTVAHAFSSQTGTGVGVNCMFASNTGRITLARTPADSNHNVECSGAFNTFASAVSNGMILTTGSGNRLVFNGAGCEGKRYVASNGSSINTDSGSVTYFPGDVDGTVDSSTYCWYA